MALCDELVYVPQHGSAVSLNVNVATAIVLHHFAQWAQYAETPREGNQFSCPPELKPNFENLPKTDSSG